MKRSVALAMSASLILAACSDPPVPQPLDTRAFSAPRRVPATEPAATPATIPATREAGDSTGPRGGDISPTQGTFVTAGSVLALLNGQPIYSDRVVRAQIKVLQARARDLSKQEFGRVVSDIIGERLQSEIRNELEFAAAKRLLSAQDVQLADRLTEEWKRRRINEAGGSLEMARANAAGGGEDFDQLVQDQYRIEMTRLFYIRRFAPLRQVSAADMRRYYNANVASFSEPDRAEFLVIASSFAAAGSEAAAKVRIDQLRARVVAGGDMATIAKEASDDPTKSLGGLIDMTSRGSLSDAYKPLDAVLWDTPVGSVTPVVKAGDRFIFAKVKSREFALTRPFEEAKVQDEIRKAIEQQQFKEFREQMQEDMRKAADLKIDKKAIDTLIMTVTDNHSRWRSAK